MEPYPFLADLSRNLLKLYNEGAGVRFINVVLTRAEIHRIFSAKFAYNYPLEIVLAKGTAGGEKRIDCRQFKHPWVIDIRTKEQLQAEAESAVQALKFQQRMDTAIAQDPTLQELPSSDDQTVPAAESESLPSPAGG